MVKFLLINTISLLFAFSLIHSTNALANCDIPGISQSFCESTLAAFKGDSCDIFPDFSSEKSLCKEFQTAIRQENCSGIFDYFGHCKAMLSFRTSSCESIQDITSHQSIICNA